MKMSRTGMGSNIRLAWNWIDKGLMEKRKKENKRNPILEKLVPHPTWQPTADAKGSPAKIRKTSWLSPTQMADVQNCQLHKRLLL